MNTPKRRRCLTTGCNPALKNEAEATVHREQAGHRTSAWPVRGAEGKRRAKARNRNGYYDKYNVGEKSYAARGLGGNDDEFVLTGEDFSMDSAGPFSGDSDVE